VKPRLREAFPAEWDYLRTLPHALETERFIFAHAGVTPGKPLRAHRRQELNRVDRFLARAVRGERWVIVGHYPVVLYGEDRVCANPIIDREKRVACLDGGCVLKDDGQLNALLIPDRDSEDFSFAAYDPFPERTVLRAQAESRQSYYIRWGDNRVEVLERGAEFSRCRHLRTGYEMDILTKYLFTDEPVTAVNDCSDYVLPLRAGERVRVVEETSRGYYVKHKGTSGWYFGELL
jgi:protein phosphatase